MQEIQKQINDFICVCKSKSLSVTPQRLAIYKTLIKDETHPNPECVYKAIKPDFPTISLATVYKTLETFEKHNIISVVTRLHETVRYDAFMEPHHHVVCVNCKKVVDVIDPELDNLKIPKNLIKDNQLVDHRVQINVICANCRAS